MDFERYDVIDFVCDHSFQQYCLGQDEAACHFWAGWIAAHPEKGAAVAEAKALFALLSARQGNLQEQLRQLKLGLIGAEDFKKQIAGVPPVGAGQRKPLARAMRFAIPIGVAAVGALCFLTMRYWPEAGFPTPEFSEQLAPSETVGARKTITLPDGTVVLLADSSNIRTADGFGRTNRTVYLTGQAYFDVTHQADRPFTVLGTLTKTVVLGTAFTVREDVHAGIAEVTLLRGKVEVNPRKHPGQVATILPAQRYVYRQDRPANGKRDTILAAPREVAWAKQTFDFENDPLETIIEELSAWYGIQARFDDQDVKHYRYTGRFQGESIQQILESLQLSYPFHFRMKGNTLYISK
ncbi:FecR family protein [Parapedobacter deserti]|uniref:FecR family protein n=1 Tax=Parapedobacter deserti TaxID=1912957 RepID=A0ABV7JP20_9SPHI